MTSAPSRPSSRPPRPPVTKSDIRHVLRLAGLPEYHPDAHPAGGFRFASESHSGRIHVEWMTESGFGHRSGELGVDQPHHRLVRMERDITTAMTRAIAEILTTAGYTVALVPEIVAPENDYIDAQDPHVIVLTASRIRTWEE